MKWLPVALTMMLVVTGCAATDSPGTGAPPLSSGPATFAGKVAVSVVARDLAVPWGMALLPDGSVLVTHRDSAEISRVQRDGSVTEAGTVADVVPGGEGGLLGIAVAPRGAAHQVFVYFTAASDNRVARLDWDGSRLSGQRTILSGIPKEQIHNGGRIAFGPDGLLYVATGDAGVGEMAQDPDSLGGKILRLTETGRPAPGNPVPGSPVFSLGHRNVQGLAWDDDGRLWASEFGQSDADELNLIRPGGNYGWPQCEGRCGQPDFTDPAQIWSPTAIASPSGMAISGGSAWIASLRGEALWEVPLDGESAGEPRVWLQGERGRLRDVINGPDGSLWVATNNTDGRGDPGPGDDRILRVERD